MTLTAWTYSRTRSVSVSPRMSRAGTSQATKAMTRISSVSDGWKITARTMSRNSMRDRQQDVDDPHHERVDPAAEEADMAP